MSDKLPDIIPLEPYYREMVWGGRRLQALYGKALPPAVAAAAPKSSVRTSRATLGSITRTSTSCVA